MDRRRHAHVVIAFFLITNFAVWAVGPMYPHTFGGLITCYVAGAAFIQYEGQTYHFLLSQIGGDLFYTALLFGGLALAESRWPALRDAPATAMASH